MNKNIPLTSNSLNKDQNNTNNTRKIYLHSYRNKPNFKIIRSNNTYTNHTVNLNIFDSVKNNRKRLLSSLKSNSIASKIMNFGLNNIVDISSKKN